VGGRKKAPTEKRQKGGGQVSGPLVLGSPFKFHVDSLASGYVTAYGPGLIYGVCGEPGNFTISTKGAGAGGLSLAVEGPSKAEISCHDNKDGTVSVSYLPTAPGEYKISVKFGDKHIKGSPYNSKITGECRTMDIVAIIKPFSGYAPEDPLIMAAISLNHCFSQHLQSRITNVTDTIV
jgi:hypothetical protein